MGITPDAYRRDVLENSFGEWEVWMLAVNGGKNPTLVLMLLEKELGHKWTRNSQGYILLRRGALGESRGATCRRCGFWFSAELEDPSCVQRCIPLVPVQTNTELLFGLN